MRASASAFSTIASLARGPTIDGEHAAPTVGHDDGEAVAIGGECGGIDERLHLGGGELYGVRGGIHRQRGGVAIGDGDLDEAAAGAGGKRELHVGIVHRYGFGRRAGDQDLRGVGEVFALDDEGLARLGGSVVGDWSAGLVRHYGADHTVAQFGAQGRLGGERKGEEEEQKYAR